MGTVGTPITGEAAMCGIAGIMYKDTTERFGLGKALIDMLDGCQHRGPDSTGFALYADNAEGRHGLRFFIGEGSEATTSVARIKQTLAKQGATLVDEEIIGENYRVEVEFSGDIQAFAYAMEHAAKLWSLGTSLDIVKDIGGAHDVDDRYNVRNHNGSHGIGHVRLATESMSNRKPRIRSGQRAFPTLPLSTTVRSRIIGKCGAASRRAISNSAPTMIVN